MFQFKTHPKKNPEKGTFISKSCFLSPLPKNKKNKTQKKTTTSF